MTKLYQAKTAISAQQARVLKCLYYGCDMLIVFTDIGDYIQTKCWLCGQEILFSVCSKEEYYS